VQPIAFCYFHYSYCDVWRFRDGKMVELKAFVIKTEIKDETSSAA
jgi:uncharacterized protein